MSSFLKTKNQRRTYAKKNKDIFEEKKTIFYTSLITIFHFILLYDDITGFSKRNILIWG